MRHPETAWVQPRDTWKLLRGKKVGALGKPALEQGRGQAGTVWTLGRKAIPPAVNLPLPRPVTPKSVTFSRPKDGPQQGHPPPDTTLWVSTAQRVMFSPGEQRVPSAFLSPPHPWSYLHSPFTGSPSSLDHHRGLPVSGLGFLQRPQGSSRSAACPPLRRSSSRLPLAPRLAQVSLVSGQTYSSQIPRIDLILYYLSRGTFGTSFND